MEILIGHLIGDYLLQNDWQSLNKKTKSWPCIVHCLLYTVAVVICTGIGLLGTLIVFLTHFLIDRWEFVSWYMQKTGKVRFLRTHSPWSQIITDNTFHLCILYLVVKYNLFLNGLI